MPQSLTIFVKISQEPSQVFPMSNNLPCAARPLNHQFGKYKIHNRNIEIKHIFFKIKYAFYTMKHN